MYRISIEMPPGYWDRVDFLLNWSDDFEDFGMALGARPQIAGNPNEIALFVGLVDSGNRFSYTGDGMLGIDLGILSLYGSPQ